MKNVIISAATNCAAEDLQIFLCSAAEACPQADVILIREQRGQADVQQLRSYNPNVQIWSPPEHAVTSRIARRLRSRGGSVVRSLQTVGIRFHCRNGRMHRAVASRCLHLMISRFLYAGDILRERGESCEAVALTDSRDVVFQADPFVSLPPGKLVVGEETCTVAQSKYNSDWLRVLYGTKRVEEQFASQPVLCAGVSVGRVDVVRRYLQCMEAEICNQFDHIVWQTSYDQAMHNFHLRTGAVPFAASRNGHGSIATLSRSAGATALESLQAAQDGTLYNQDGHPVAIVHQYDRWPELNGAIRQRYSSR